MHIIFNEFDKFHNKRKYDNNVDDDKQQQETMDQKFETVQVPFLQIHLKSLKLNYHHPQD
jgi:hypothetical protein